MSLTEIILKFKEDIYVIVSDGSNLKKHLLSPLQTKLTSYITALFNLDCLKVFNHNRFNTLDSSTYLPYFDLSNKYNISFTKQGLKL